jgi:hypothetical protein
MYWDRFTVASQLVQVPDLFLGAPAEVQTLDLRLYRLVIASRGKRLSKFQIQIEVFSD